MALNIKNDLADELARRLALATGETITEAVTRAVRERLERVEGRKSSWRLRKHVSRIQDRLASLPVQDDRSAEEILDYDDQGLPG